MRYLVVIVYSTRQLDRDCNSQLLFFLSMGAANEYFQSNKNKSNLEEHSPEFSFHGTNVSRRS